MEEQMSDLLLTLRRHFGTFRKRVETDVKEEFARSKSEGLALYELAHRFASDALKEGARLTEEVSLEFKVESSLFLRQLQKRLMSEVFEQHLDDVLAHVGKTTDFETANPHDEAWFEKIHTALYKDPFEGFDPAAAEARRARIGRKLGFLLRFYRDGLVETSVAGGLFGALLGPATALKFAIAAGGLKLAFDLGGVSYAVFIKENGELSFA